MRVLHIRSRTVKMLTYKQWDGRTRRTKIQADADGEFITPDRYSMSLSMADKNEQKRRLKNAHKCRQSRCENNNNESIKPTNDIPKLAVHFSCAGGFPAQLKCTEAKR